MLKKITCSTLSAFLTAALLISCAQTPSSSIASSAPSASAEASSAPAQTSFQFTDSAGRTVEIPANIERIAPSGPVAQLVLYTLCPDKLAGLASAFTDEQKPFINEAYWGLPVLGNLYADTLNREALVAAAPQLIIDIGEKKDSTTEDMDSIQNQTDIPTIFIQMDNETMPQAYAMLGEVTGEQAAAKLLADYIETTLTDAAQKTKDIAQDKRATVYFAEEANGLTANVAGTVHSFAIDMAGGINVAEVESNLRGGLYELSMEQLLVWNPDVILLSTNEAYKNAISSPEWASLSAVKNGTVYGIPTAPFNWMGRPPSVNRILGIRWLGNLLYPEIFTYDMIQETQEFYKLFYHVELTEAAAKELLQFSTYKN